MDSLRVLGKVADLIPAQVGLPLRRRVTPGLEAELGLIPHFAASGSVAVDVGANHGVYTYALSRAVGPRGRVLAYEPQAKLAAYVRAGTSRARNVTVYQAALGSCPGTAELTVPLREGHPETAWATLRANAGPGDRKHVQLRVLDEDLAGLAPSFIKIDVEGFELAVVEGALKTLERARPVTMIEIEHRWAQDSAAKTLHVMREHAYEPWVVDVTTRRRLRRLEWAALSDIETMNDVIPGQRTFNFLFRPAG
jgi:FkbM family methyltransferase